MVRDRTHNGLRGPVKSCKEETTFPAAAEVRAELRSREHD